MAVPPVEAAYQSITSSVPAVALMVTVPVPQREALPAVGVDGNAFTVVVMAFDVAGEPVAQVAFDVITTVITSLFARPVVV